MKKAISSEKEFVRNLVGSLEMKMETKADTQATSNSLESRVEALENTIAEQTIPRHLQSRMESMEKNLDIVQTLSDGLEDRIESVERKLDSVETNSGGIENRMDSVESGVSSLILASGRKVSFSVQYRPPSGTDATRLKKQRIIRFNHVFYNDGSGYNETTGIFKMPVSGVYQFIFFVEGWQLKDDFICQAAIVALYVDGSSAGTAAVADPRHKTQHMQAGNAYINYFRKGQKVLVATASTCDEYIIFGYRTTFNGVLLY
ncbi:uncharacterized protein LOC123526472 [Mercenaria mercenaria]|uniref:uncharacterized protein LOC123526472 n=1 Tax=Mercenaria mercenaria TaxID=6596 RepID=UPI00234E870F|nr:uncharacterized protein LOC123526472 [Mercenaria mercenaria]